MQMAHCLVFNVMLKATLPSFIIYTKKPLESSTAEGYHKLRGVGGKQMLPCCKTIETGRDMKTTLQFRSSMIL